MEVDPEVGIEGPPQPCAECQAVTQKQMVVAIAVGAALGIGAFYVIARLNGAS